MTIYTLGYSGWRIEQVQGELERLDGLLVDVRMVPRSRLPAWNSGVLGRRLGDASGPGRGRYVWLKSFGNRNYRGSVDQIEIVDFPAGQQRLRELLTPAGGQGLPGRSPVLLCGCADVNVCHRKLLAAWLAQAWDAEVVHLAPPAAGPTLF